MDLAAPFCRCSTLAGTIAFVDDGAVKNVFSQGDAEEEGAVGEEFDGFKDGEGVEGC